MPKDKDVVAIMESVGAIMRDDHFVLTSGKHSSVYINKDALYPHVQQTAQIGKLMAETCAHLKIDTVVAPALGGIILSQWVGYYLSKLESSQKRKKKRQVHSVFAEKDGEGGFIFTRGYDQFITGRDVLVLEDLTSTGGSVKKVVGAVREYRGNVSGVCVMVNRNPQEVSSKMFDAPFFSLGELPSKAYDEKDLPEEIKKRPVNTAVGHGKEYLAKKRK